MATLLSSGDLSFGPAVRLIAGHSEFQLCSEAIAEALTVRTPQGMLHASGVRT
jgi:hypothetical protein